MNTTDTSATSKLIAHQKSACLASLLILSLTACGDKDPQTEPSSKAIAAPTELIFEDRAEATGFVFEHFSGQTGNHYMPEIMSAGIALLDVDNDDDLDIFVLQGRDLDPEVEGDGMIEGVEPGHRLFRNEINPTGELTFTDVSESSGIDDRGYGMGLAVGDIDNDGDQDIYLAHYGENYLYLNDGDGSFTDITASSGTGDDRFGSSTAFLDYDSDGLLDLYVANYNNFTVSNHQSCNTVTGEQDYCDPLAYPPAVDRIFRNLGDGKFVDTARETGV